MSTTARASKARPRRPRDVNQLAAAIVARATAEREPEPPAAVPELVEPPRRKNPAAVRLGKLGGKASGKVRMAKISPERRKEIAKKAAMSRWKKFA